MPNGAVRVSSAQLRTQLGEPDDIDIQHSGGTIMRYKWRWTCGCRAEGTVDSALCAPCSRHYAALGVI